MESKDIKTVGDLKDVLKSRGIEILILGEPDLEITIKIDNSFLIKEKGFNITMFPDEWCYKPRSDDYLLDNILDPERPGRKVEKVEKVEKAVPLVLSPHDQKIIKALFADHSDINIQYVKPLFDSEREDSEN